MTRCQRYLCTLTVLLPGAFSAAQEPVALSPDLWKATTSGAFETWVDRRDLAVLHHPWAASEAGHFAAITQSVRLPESWTSGAQLYFYLSDDYDGSREPVTDNWLGQINLRGHRFEQVLVNGEVVWERDVSDAIDTQSGLWHQVPLPETVRPGDPVTVTIRLEDRVGSMERLDGDHRYIGTTDKISEDEPWKFRTNLYVGDVMLAPAGEDARSPSAMPAVKQFRKRHAKGASLEPVGTPVTFPVTLPVRNPPPGTAFPIDCGLPLPAGALHDATGLRLKTPDGTELPTEFSAMNRWPDGSLRWVRVGTIAPPGTTRLQLDIADTPEAKYAPAPAKSDWVAVDAGTLTITKPNADPLTLTPTFRIGGSEARLDVDTIRSLSSNTLQLESEVVGQIRTDTVDYGRCVLRIRGYRDQPWLRLTVRFFNDRPETLPIAKQTLHIDWNREQTGGIELPEAPGAFGLTGDGDTLFGLVRHYAEQQPKSIDHSADGIVLNLVDSPDGAPAYQPHEGEAKRHEIWLGLWDQVLTRDEIAAQAAWMAHPPGLFDPGYFCATGGLGLAAPHDATQFPELTTHMKETYDAQGDDAFFETGIRDWGDKPYSVEENTWRNGYYDTQQGFASEYLMTGDPVWFRRLEAVVRHIIDIDVCHASEEHPDWVGGIHGYYGKDHSTEAPWNPMQRTKGTLAYWRLTGDHDARDAALAVADSAIAAARGIGAVSVRDHAGILYCLTAAYDETRDEKYLKGAKRVAHDALKRIDMRRGTYVEIHGNYSYQGNVPWMVAQLMEPMYDYYRQSGDIVAGEAVVAMAASILAENRTRGVPGDVFGYSHNPHFKKSSSYHILIAPAILYAYELTGDTEFLRQGRAMYRQTIEEGTVNSIMNCYWNTPTLLYYLDKYAGVEPE